MSATTELRAARAQALAASLVRMLAIGETGKYINGVAFKPTDWGDEGLPIVRIQNLTDQTKPMNRTTRIVDPAYVVQPGDLLVSWSATLDAFIWDREPALLNQHIFKVVPNAELVSKRYLFFALRQAIAEMGRTEHLHGSTMKHINRGPFLAHRIPVPPLRAQAEIVAELEKQFSRLDEAVANLKRVKASLKRYKAAVLKAAVDGRLVPTEVELASHEGRSSETGAQLLASILQERRRGWNGKGSYREPAAPVEGFLPSLPNGWTVASLEALTSAARVICYGILMPKENVADGVLYVKVRDMKEDAIDLASLHRTSRAIAAGYARASLRAGDLLLSIRGTYGRVAAVPSALEGGNITQDTARLDVSRHLDAFFVATFLRSEDAQRYFKTVARGVAVKGVNIGDLRPMAVPVPPLAEQRRIVAEVDRRLSIVREVEAEVDANLKRAQALRQAVLARAFEA